MSTRKDQLKSLLLNLPPQGGPAAAPEQKAEQPAVNAPARAVSGSVRAMGLSLDRLGAAAQEADLLRAQLAAGDSVVEIDPLRIAPSFVSDRMAAEAGAGWGAGDADFAAFVADIQAHGQQSPILVRPHPDEDGGYQIAYGHRRWRAALTLARRVKAVVRPLSDAELVVAQGQENAQRRDLSFIEKAFFARTLDERGFDRATLIAALAVQTAEVTRLLQVARAIPASLAGMIGPAPRAGRPRWMELAEGLKNAATLARVTAVLEAERMRDLSSDERFVRAFAALSVPKPRAAFQRQPVRDRAGTRLAQLTLKPTGASLVLDAALPAEFAGYVAEALPDLYARWQAARS